MPLTIAITSMIGLRPSSGGRDDFDDVDKIPAGGKMGTGYDKASDPSHF